MDLAKANLAETNCKMSSTAICGGRSSRLAMARNALPLAESGCGPNAVPNLAECLVQLSDSSAPERHLSMAVGVSQSAARNV